MTSVPYRDIPFNNSLDLVEAESVHSLYEYKVALVLWQYCSPPILVIGTVGSVISIIVLCQKSMRQQTTMFYLAVLGVADLLTLLVGLLRFWIEKRFDFYIRLQSDWACKLHTFCVYVSLHFSVWILVAVSVDRCLFVSLPYAARRWCTLRRSRMATAVVALGVSVINAHFLWTYRRELDNSTSITGNAQYRCYVNSESKVSQMFIKSVWPWVDFCVYCMTPFIIMLGTNVVIARHLIKSDRRMAVHRRRALTNPTSGQNYRERSIHVGGREKTSCEGGDRKDGRENNKPTRQTDESISEIDAGNDVNNVAQQQRDVPVRERELAKPPREAWNESRGFNLCKQRKEDARIDWTDGTEEPREIPAIRIVEDLAKEPSTLFKTDNRIYPSDSPTSSNIKVTSSNTASKRWNRKSVFANNIRRVILGIVRMRRKKRQNLISTSSNDTEEKPASSDDSATSPHIRNHDKKTETAVQSMSNGDIDQEKLNYIFVKKSQAVTKQLHISSLKPKFSTSTNKIHPTNCDSVPFPTQANNSSQSEYDGFAESMATSKDISRTLQSPHCFEPKESPTTPDLDMGYDQDEDGGSLGSGYLRDRRNLITEPLGYNKIIRPGEPEETPTSKCALQIEDASFTKAEKRDQNEATARAVNIGVLPDGHQCAGPETIDALSAVNVSQSQINASEPIYVLDSKTTCADNERSNNSHCCKNCMDRGFHDSLCKTVGIGTSSCLDGIHVDQRTSQELRSPLTIEGCQYDGKNDAIVRNTGKPGCHCPNLKEPHTQSPEVNQQHNNCPNINQIDVRFPKVNKIDVRFPKGNTFEVSYPIVNQLEVPPEFINHLDAPSPNIYRPNKPHQNEKQCNIQSQTATQSHVQSQTATQSHTQSQTATQSRVQSQTATQSRVQSQTATQSRVQSQTATQSHVQSQTATQSHVQSQTATQSRVQSQTATQSHVQSQTATKSQVQSQTATQSQVQSQTATQSHVQSQTATQSHVQSQTPTQSHVQSQTPTQSHVQSQTPTQSHVQSQTATQSQVQSQTATQSHVQSQTATQSHVQSQTATQSQVQSQTANKPDTLSLNAIQSNSISSSSCRPQAPPTTESPAYSLKRAISTMLTKQSSVTPSSKLCYRNNTTSISFTLLMVNVLFWLLNAPVVIYIIGFTYWIEDADGHTLARLELAWAVVNILQYSNNAAHVFMYCLTGPKFRRQLRNVLSRVLCRK